MRSWIFRIIALAIPFVFFLLLELGLRLADFGHSYPLFIENPANRHYLLPRPDIIKRYFGPKAEIPNVTMEANFLLKDKPANGYRVFVQGGSTAAGFPYGLGASVAGMLDNRLKATLSRHYVEVVNTAMSAVNSYTVLDFADEIIQQKPDAVLIYMGHNEYLGILGVGSNYTAANSQASTLLFLKLKELRIFQLLQGLYGEIKGTGSPETRDLKGSRTFMAKVAKHKNIPFGSALYQAGIEQFDTNLGLLLAKYQKAGVPVYLATIASNLRDHAPFVSEPLRDEHKEKLQQLADALSSHNPSAAKIQITELLALAASLKHGLLYYHLGQLQAKLGDVKGAASSFLQAKELDLLRFRAPEKINQVIRKHAKQHDQVYLVDVATRLANSSPDKIIGNNLMLEHLHPNLQGYFLLADSFYQSLEKYAGLGDWQNVDIAQAWRDRPLIPSEEYLGFAKILQLKADYPFTDTAKKLTLPRPADWQQALGKQQFLKKIDWLSMMQQALARYRTENNIAMSRKVMQLLADALPHDEKINRLAGDAFRQNRQHGLSIYYYLRSVTANTNNPQTYAALINAYKHTGQDKLALIWQNKLAELKIQ